MENVINYIKKCSTKSITIASIGIGLCSLFGIKLFLMGSISNIKKDLTNKIIIITCADNGIGKVTAFELLKQGATVIFACKDEMKTLAVINEINIDAQKQKAIFMYLDLSKFSSVIAFVDNFKSKYKKLD